MQEESNGFTHAIDFQLEQVRFSQLDVGINIERRLGALMFKGIKVRPYSKVTVFCCMNTGYTCVDIQ